MPDGMTLDNVPFKELNYDAVHHVCCENVIGYVPIPLGTLLSDNGKGT